MSLHRRIGFVFGLAEEVTRITAYHRDPQPGMHASPLFERHRLFSGQNG